MTKPIDFDLLDTIIAARLAGVARNELWPKRVELNEREVETLTWAARGKTSAEIAQILGLTKRTVDFHIDNARAKLGAATRTEAVLDLLLRISETRQVILFSQERDVLAWADRNLAAPRHRVTRLSGPKCRADGPR